MHFSETNPIFEMSNKDKYRKVSFFKNYFGNFFKKQPQKVKDKIIWTLELIEILEKVPEKYLKHLEGTRGIYEIRINTYRKSVRIFCFFAKEKLIILSNAFIKKSKKTPQNEIKRAIRIKEEYNNENN